MLHSFFACYFFITHLINASLSSFLKKARALCNLDLTAGTYAVLVRRVGGASCQTAQEVVITQPDLINFTVIKTDILCANDAGGSIEINATGGKSGSYQYSNDNGLTWQDENIFSGLDAGSYLVWVRDKNNHDCQSNPQNVNLSSSTAMTLSVSTLDLWCNSSADGEITATGSGGSGTLNYSIDGGTTYQTSGVFTGLDAGDYTVVLKDENGCELFYENNPVTLSEPQGVTFNSVDITYGACDGGLGSINIDASSLLGSMMYSIDGGANYVSTPYFGDLSSGTYNVLVKENDGCENAYAENPIELTLASELSVTIVATPDNNLSSYYPITLTAEGPDIATYSWNTLEDTESIVFSTDTPGAYNFTVDVVSDHGCTASDAITLDFNAGSPINITVDPVSDEYCTSDKVNLIASADNAVSYLWRPDNVASNTILVQKEEAGEFMYYIDVTNSTGCISMDSVQLIYKECTGINELDTDGVEINIFPKPSFSASLILCSILETGLISPDKPISPAKHIFLLIEKSIFEDNIAAKIAISVAGSVTFNPPAIFRKTSFVESLNPALFSKTAKSIFNLLMSKVVLLL